ncbi:hypothetical protein Pyn_03982 [Prunus yedoensis var. nudiflora]|uniref:Uncharacterized protein n=1 Tax=Prunus yedoensis var. nudiflora TaxID=2094558 RepID=A0A314YA13_PRUYE|nr:hypothetical protein Pyn_03982 [Prunus yedoensis var. nudiflora]
MEEGADELATESLESALNRGASKSFSFTRLEQPSKRRKRQDHLMIQRKYSQMLHCCYMRSRFKAKDQKDPWCAHHVHHSTQLQDFDDGDVTFTKQRLVPPCDANHMLRDQQQKRLWLFVSLMMHFIKAKLSVFELGEFSFL